MVAFEMKGKVKLSESEYPAGMEYVNGCVQFRTEAQGQPTRWRSSSTNTLPLCTQLWTCFSEQICGESEKNVLGLFAIEVS